MKVLVVIASVIGTLILVRIAEMLLRFFIGSRQRMKFILKYFPVLELSATLFIIFWAIEYLFSSKSYYQIILLSLIISLIALISWFVVRDFIAGIVFRTQNNLNRGATMKFGEIAGKLLSMRTTHIVVETDEGRVIKIPYSRIISEIVSEHPEDGVREDSMIRLEVKKKMKWNELESSLKNTILNTPWRLLTSEPKIKLLAEQDKYYEIQIYVRTRSKKHEENLKALLSNKFEKE